MVKIYDFVFAGVTDSVAIGIFLIAVRIFAVVASVTDTVSVSIILNGFAVFITEDFIVIVSF